MNLKGVKSKENKYSKETYILLFFSFSFFGWLWEVLWHLARRGALVNRGVMHGPWLPIYGAGGILILTMLKRFKNNPLLMFVTTSLLCGIIEYVTSWYLEIFFHLKYWDYHKYMFNINGRICIEGLILFGLGGCLFTYKIAPFLIKIFDKLSEKTKIVLCIVLVVLFQADLVYTNAVKPNTGKGISKEAITLNNEGTIKLKTNAGIPYTWKYEIEDEEIVKYIGKKEKIKHKNMTGSETELYYKFKGLKKGETIVTFNFVNFVDNKAEKTEKYKVKVDKNLNVIIDKIN